MCWLRHVLNSARFSCGSPTEPFPEKSRLCAPVNQSKIQQHILLEVAVQAELAFLTASSQEALLERVTPKQGERGAVCSVYTAHVCPG